MKNKKKNMNIQKRKEKLGKRAGIFRNEKKIRSIEKEKE
jgi:hypothetical protein